MPEDRIKDKILRFLEQRKSKVTFHDLYVALSKQSEQGIRNAVYEMIEEGTVRRVKLDPDTLQRAGLKTRTAFELAAKE